MQELVSLRFVFVTGKGGVGKSTVSAALSVRGAEQGKRTLLVFAEGNRAPGYLFDVAIGRKPTAIAPGLFAMAIDPEDALREYAEDAIGSRFVAGAILTPQVARGFLRGIPGLLPWALLGKAWYATTSARSGPELPGAPYDLVVFDGYSTGDGTDLLRIPRTVVEIAPPGRLRRDAESCYEMLMDASRSRIVPVSLPRALSATEVSELVREVRAELGYPLGPVLLNQWRAPVFGDDERRALLSRGPFEPGSPERVLFERAGLEEAGERALAQLRTLGQPIWSLPACIPAPRGSVELGKLVARAESR